MTKKIKSGDIILSEGEFEWAVPRELVAKLASERAKDDKYDDIMVSNSEAIDYVMSYVTWDDIAEHAKLTSCPVWKEKPNMNICNVEVWG